MSKYKVVITDSNYQDTDIEKKILNKIDAKLTLSQCKSSEEVIKEAKGADGLLNQYAPITKEVFNQLGNLKVVARYGIGIDTIDVEAATEKGVAVVNVPSYCEEEVSDHTVALLLCCLRKINLYDREVKNGHWDWKAGIPIKRLKGKTLGIIALGKIAREVIDKIKPFGFQVIAYDPYISKEVFDGLGITQADNLKDLLIKADVVCVHAPLTRKTKHLIGEHELEMMKSEAVLINTSRGGVVDNEALYQALREGQIAMAGLDVLEEEPPLTPISENPLVELDNIILTPHAAWYSKEAVIELRTKASQGVAKVLIGEKPKGLVNEEIAKQMNLK